MSKCYDCHTPATGEHKVIILGRYDKGTRDKKVDLCKPCYDKVLEKERNEARRDRFKAINSKPFTAEDYKKQVQDDFRNGTGL